MSSNFEKAGLALEIKGFQDYIEQLKKVDDAHISAGGTADTLAGKLTNLEATAQRVFKTIADGHIDLGAMGIAQLGTDMDAAGNKATAFGQDMSVAAQALRKIEQFAGSIDVFDKITLSLIANTELLQAGFTRIQELISNINLKNLTDGATTAAVGIQKLADSMRELNTNLGGNGLVDNLSRLIPVLLAAGDIKKLGAVGISINALVKALAKIGDLPDFAKNQGNFDALLKFMDRLATLKIPATLAADFIAIGDALIKLTPGLVSVNKIDLQKHTTDGIDSLLTTLEKFKGIDTTNFAALADGIEKLGTAFRSFGAGGEAGKRFTGAALAIAKAVDELLTTLNNFASQADAPKFIGIIQQLGDAMKVFAQGMASLGSRFSNTFANIPTSVIHITRAIESLENSFSNIKDLPAFTSNLTSLGAAMKALQVGFASVGRSTSIRNDLAKSINEIILAIQQLSTSDIQEAATRIEALIAPIRGFALALQVLRKSKLSSGMVSSLKDLGGTLNIFGQLERAAQALIATVAALGEAFVKAFASLGKFAFAGIIEGLSILLNAIKDISIFLLKIPFTIVVKGFELIVGAVNLLLIPIKALMDLLGKLGSLFANLFSGKSKKVAGDLGLAQSSNEIDTFENRVQKLQGTLNKTDDSTSKGSKGIRDFGSAADKTSADVSHLDNTVNSLENHTGFLSRVFGSNELLQVAGTFKAVDVAVNLAQNAIFGLTTGIGNLIGEAVKSASDFEQLNLQLTSLQAKEAVKKGLFPDVPTALTKGVDFLSGKVDGLINQFRVLAIQSPFETNDITGAFKMAQAFGFDTDQAKELTQTLVDAGTALGFTGQDLQDTVKVFGQIHTAGKLNAQDLNQLAQRGINVKQILNDLAGKQIDFANTTIDADDAIKAVTHSLQHDFAGAAARSADSITGLIGSFASFKDEALRTFIQPTVEGLRDVFVGLADTLFKPEVFDKIEAAGQQAFEILEKIIVGISSVAGVVARIFDSIPQPFLDFLVLLGKAALASIAFTTAVVGIQAGFAIFSAALIFILNPLGQLAIEVFLITTALQAMTSETMNAFQSLTLLAQIVAGAFNFKDALTQLSLIIQLPKPIQQVALAIGNLAADFGIAVDTVKTFAQIFADAFQAGNVFVTPVINGLEKLNVAFQGVGLQAANVAVFLRGLYNNLVSFAVGLGTSIESAIGNLRDTVINTFNGIVESSSQAVNQLLTVAGNVATFFNGLIQNVADFGSGVVSAFASGMQSAVNLVVEAVNAIADAITYLLAPGSPPRALPDIDDWGKAAGEEFINGISEADTTSILKLANGIQDSLGKIKLPDNSSLNDIFSTMGWTQDDAGNIVDALGNIVIAQNQLADAAGTVADQLSRVNAQIDLLTKQQNIQKQQNLVDNLKAALKQPGISESNKQVLEQQLARAELELKRQQLLLDQQDQTGQNSNGLGSGSSSSGSKAKAKKEKAVKDVPEPDQKLPSVVKPKKGKAVKDALDLPDVESNITQALDNIKTKGGGILEKIQAAFTNARDSIGKTVGNLRDILAQRFEEIRQAAVDLYNNLKPTLDQIGQAFQDTFGKLNNQGPIVGGLTGLAVAIGLGAGWDTLAIIAGGLTLLGGAWAIASGQVTLKLPDNLKILQDQLDNMRAGFDEAKKTNKSLSESILGFNTNDFSKSIGSLIETLGVEVGKFFTKLDTAITLASNAAKKGNNPVLAFLDSLFNLEDIRTRVTKEITEVGKLISTIISGQLSTILNPSSISTSEHVRDKGTGSFIADFIISQIINAATLLNNFDIAKEFDTFKTNLKNTFDSLFGTGADGKSKTDTFVKQFQDIVDKINNIIIHSGDWSTFTSDLDELGKSLQQFSGIAIPVGITGIMTAISLIVATISQTPEITQSSIQIINDSVGVITNLASTINSISTGNFSKAATDLKNAVHDFIGVFGEFKDIDQSLFKIVNTTIDNIIRIGNTVLGIKDPNTFSAGAQALSATLNGVAEALIKLAESQLLASLPALVKIEGGLPTLTGAIVALGFLSGAIEDYDAKHPDVDLAPLTNTINQISYISLIALGANALSNGTVFKLLIPIFGWLWNLIDIAILIPVGGAIPGIMAGLTGFIIDIASFVNVFILIPISSAIPAISATVGEIFDLLGEMVIEATGILAGLTAADVIALTSIVTLVAGFIDGFINDFAGIRTELVGDITKSFDGIGEMFDGLGKLFSKSDKIRTEGIDKIGEGFAKFIAFGLKFNQFTQAGTAENIRASLATIEGIADLIDKLFGTHFATKLNDMFLPLVSFFNQGGTTGDAVALGLTKIQTSLEHFVAINIGPLNGIIEGILGLLDAFNSATHINWNRIFDSFKIVTDLTSFFTNPAANIGNIGNIKDEITNFLTPDPKAQQGLDQTKSLLQQYKDTLKGWDTPQTINPPVTIEPNIIIPFSSSGSRNFVTPNGQNPNAIINILGIDPSKSVDVPIQVAPTVTIDQTPIDAAYASLAASTQTTFSGLEATVNTSTTNIQTKINTDFPAIATAITNAGVTGTQGFIDELGKVPDETVDPKNKIIAQLDGYGKEFNDSGVGLGEDFTAGFQKGIDNKTKSVIDASTALASLAIHSVRSTIQSASPSKAMEKEGNNFGDGFWIGMGATRNKVNKGAAELAKGAIKSMADTIVKGQGTVLKAVQKVIGGIFEDKGLKIDFSKWEIVSDSETDVKKRAKDSATSLAEQFGNEFARVTNQVFDDIVSNDPSLAPDIFNTDDINKTFDDEINSIFKHRDDTLAQLSGEGKKEFDRNFLAAFTDPEGVKKVADDFLQQFSDTDLLNLPKMNGLIEKFVGNLRAKLTEKANAGDGFATSLLGGLDDLDKALHSELQSAIDTATTDATGQSTQDAAASVGSTLTSNVAAGTVSTDSLGGLQSAVDILTSALITAVQTGFATITATVTTEGNNSATGFITGIDVLNTNLPDEMTKIIGTLNGFSEKFTTSGKGLGEDFGGGFVDGIIAKIDAITTAVTNMINAAKAAAAAAQDSHSPSQDMIKEGQNFGEGFKIGILSTKDGIVKASTDVITSAADAIQKGFTTVAPILSKTLQGVVKQGSFWIDETQKVSDTVDTTPVDDTTKSMNKLEKATEEAKSIFDQLGTSFSSTFNTILDKFLESNPDAISNIWNIHDIRAAAESAGGELRDAIDNIAKELTPGGKSKFTDLIKNIFGDSDTAKTLVDDFINSFSPDELVNLKDSSGAIDTFIAKLKDALDDGEGFLKDSGLSDDLLKAFEGLSGTLKDQIQKTIDDIQKPPVAVPTTPDWITEMFGTQDDLNKIGQDTGNALAAGVAAGAESQASISAIATAAQTAIDQYVTELQNSGQIHSPSKLTMKMAGEPLVDGIIIGMKNRIPSILKTAQGISDTVSGAFGTGDAQWLQQNTLDQKVNLKYNGLVNSLPELFQKVNGKIMGNAGKLSDNIMMSGDSNARTGMLTNYSVINNTNHTQDEYHLHMDVDKNQLQNVRKGFRVARQLGIN